MAVDGTTDCRVKRVHRGATMIPLYHLFLFSALYTGGEHVVIGQGNVELDLDSSRTQLIKY